MQKFEPKYKKDTDYNRLTKIKDWWKMISANFEDLTDGVSGWTEKLLIYLKDKYIQKELKTDSESEYKVLSDNNFTDTFKKWLEDNKHSTIPEVTCYSEEEIAKLYDSDYNIVRVVLKTTSSTASVSEDGISTAAVNIENAENYIGGSTIIGGTTYTTTTREPFYIITNLTTEITGSLMGGSPIVEYTQIKISEHGIFKRCVTVDHSTVDDEVTGIGEWENLISEIHTHENKEILDNTTAPYTADDQNLLYILQALIAKAVMPENLINISYLFADGRNDSLREKLDTSYAVVMDYTYRKHILAELTVRADSAESMQHCFDGAFTEKITFSNGTPKLQLANHLFYKCSNLKTVTGLDLTNATTIKYAFSGCTSLEVVDVISTENVTDMSYAFYNSGIPEIIGINTHKSANLDGTFAKSKVIELTLDCTNVTTAKGTFTDCTDLTSLTILNAQAEIVSALFSSLPETESGTITLTDCVDITEEITAIATEKGWTVV